MKKLGLLFIFLIAFTSKFLAQGEAPSVRIGIIATPGVSWLQSTKVDLEGKGASFAFGYGIHAEFKFTKYIYLTTGLSQNNFGGKVVFKDDVRLTFTTNESGVAIDNYATIKDRSYTFNSIELPLKLKLKTPEIGYFTYFVELGLNTNVIYKATAKKNNVFDLSNASVTSEDLVKIDAEAETNWYRFGSLINVGFEYNFVGNTALLVSANWSRSFTSILKDKPDNLRYLSTGLPFIQSGNLDYAALTVGIIF